MRYIDLTLTLKEEMPGVRFETAKTREKDGWNARNLHLYSHVGTHIDAPIHYEVSDKTIDDYPPERFFTTCYVVDLEGISAGKEISVADLGDNVHKVKSGEGLLFKTGWSRFLGTDQYRNALPGISKELAHWCAEKGITVVGVEPPSVADVNNIPLVSEIHTILLEADILIIEGLSNLDKISQQKIQLVALPLKIDKGDGSPCRAIAIEKD